MRFLAEDLRQHLISEGIVADGDLYPVVSAPPAWTELEDGAPYPLDLQPSTTEPTVHLSNDGGRGNYHFEGFIQRPSVGITLRGPSFPALEVLAWAIVDAINDRRAWMMNGVRIEECLLDVFPQRDVTDQGYAVYMAFDFLVRAEYLV